MSTGEHRDKMQKSFMNVMITSFVNAKGEVAKNWLKLFAEMCKNSYFAKEFIKNGGLRMIITMLRIPHIDIVTQVNHILLAMKFHDFTTFTEGNVTRFQLIDIVSNFDHKMRPGSAAELNPLTARNPKRTKSQTPKTKTSRAVFSTVPPQAEASSLLQRIQQNRRATKKDTISQLEPLTKHITRKTKSTPVLSSEQNFLVPNEYISQIHKELQSLEKENNNLGVKIDLLRKMQRFISHGPIPTELCGEIGRVLVDLCKEDNSILFIEVCMILHLLSCQEELIPNLLTSGVMKELRLVLKGYQLDRIEYSLWVLEKVCSGSTEAVLYLYKLDIMPTLGMIMNSGIENIRLYTQYILKRMAKIENEAIRTDLKNLLSKNPWCLISKEWGIATIWSPADYIDVQIK
jgi:hypothetical protein